jgi:hypothetical protein
MRSIFSNSLNSLEHSSIEWKFGCLTVSCGKDLRPVAAGRAIRKERADAARNFLKALDELSHCDRHHVRRAGEGVTFS